MSDKQVNLRNTESAPDEEQAASLKLFVVLSKAYKSLMDHAVKDMKSYGLASAEFMVLEVLYHRTRIPLQQIGRKFSLRAEALPIISTSWRKRDC